MLVALTLAGSVTAAAPAPMASAAPVSPTAVPLGECVSSDHGNPVLQRVTLSTSRVDVRRRGQAVTMTAWVRDTGGPGPAMGVSEVFGSLIDPGGGELLRRLHVASDGSWFARFRVPRHMPPGRWTARLSASDPVGNSASWDAAELTRAGQPVGLRVVSPGDRRAPVVTEVALSRRVVDSRTDNRAVTLTVKARDLGSGVRQVGAWMEQSAGATFGSASLTDLHRASGTARHGRWRGKLVIPAWAPGGRWELRVSVADNAGRERVYTPDSPGQASRSTTPPRLPVVRVRSGVDHDLPVLDALEVSSDVIDVRDTDQTVTFELRAHDATSGLATPYVSLENNHVEIVFPLQLVAGTRTDGTWRGVWRPTRCDAVDGTWSVRPSSISDRVHNRPADVAVGAAIVVLGHDRRPPTYTVEAATSAAVPVRFDEDVAGITQVSASLRHFPGGFRSRTHVAVPGRWECRTMAGALIGCDDGPLRTATFLPDLPLVPGFYGIAFNPEHVLTVTDLAGNPASSVARPSIQIDAR